MYKRISLLSLLCVCLSNLPQLTWSRSLTVSLNMSMTRKEQDDQNISKPFNLNKELIQSCMHETDISLSQLRLFRLSLLASVSNSNNENELLPSPGTEDADLNNDNSLKDGDPNQFPYLDSKRNEPLQCFVRCLYERLGLIHSDMMLEEAYKLKLQELLVRLKPELKGCNDFASMNQCEAAYKLHLCYNHLRNLEVEQRLREILEQSDAANELEDNEDNENYVTDDETEPQPEAEKENENQIINDIQSLTKQAFKMN